MAGRRAALTQEAAKRLRQGPRDGYERLLVIPPGRRVKRTGKVRHISPGAREPDGRSTSPEGEVIGSITPALGDSTIPVPPALSPRGRAGISIRRTDRAGPGRCSPRRGHDDRRRRPAPWGGCAGRTRTMVGRGAEGVSWQQRIGHQQRADAGGVRVHGQFLEIHGHRSDESSTRCIPSIIGRLPRPR